MNLLPVCLVHPIVMEKKESYWSGLILRFSASRLVIRRQHLVRLVLIKSEMQSVYACMNIMNINYQSFAFTFGNPPFLFLRMPLPHHTVTFSFHKPAFGQ